MAVQIRLGAKIHQAKTPGIVVGDAKAVFGLGDEMIMLAGRTAVGRPDQHAPGHAQMGDQDPAIAEMDEDVLGTATHRGDLPTLDSPGQIGREGKAQIGPVQVEPADRPADQNAGEAAADGFHFGQFGHDGRR